MAVPRAAIRFALTGFGQVARQVHVPVLNRLGCVELAAIAEVDAGRREEARRLAPHAELYESQEEMLARADFRALVIWTPPPGLRDGRRCSWVSRGRSRMGADPGRNIANGKSGRLCVGGGGELEARIGFR